MSEQRQMQSEIINFSAATADDVKAAKGILKNDSTFGRQRWDQLIK